MIPVDEWPEGRGVRQRLPEAEHLPARAGEPGDAGNRKDEPDDDNAASDAKHQTLGERRGQAEPQYAQAGDEAQARPRPGRIDRERMPRRGEGAERNVALTEQNRRFRTDTFQQRARNRDLLHENRQHDQRECRGRHRRDAPAPAAGEPDETGDQ